MKNKTIKELIKELSTDKKKRKEFINDPQKVLDCYGIVLDDPDKYVFGKTDHQKSF